MTCTPGHRSRRRASMSVALSAVALGLTAPAAFAGSALPEIRMMGTNQVPACVTPERLMAFLKSRNSMPDKSFLDIAQHYKKYGEGWRVRWDYAFFQMAVETNFLTYKQGNGRWGDVNPKQNNFAGIGTTGGGVPGDSFPDVKSGVLGHIQHLVAYSGERIVDPVAPRTKLKQDDIIEASEKLNRPVTYSDLARRWAVDPKYGSSISSTANVFMRDYCKGGGTLRAVEVKAPAAGLEQLPWSAAKPAPVSVAPKPVKPVANVKQRPQAKTVAEIEALSKAPMSNAPARIVAPATGELATFPPAPKIVAAPVPVARRETAVRTVWAEPGLQQKPSAAAAAILALAVAPLEPDVASETRSEASDPLPSLIPVAAVSEGNVPVAAAPPHSAAPAAVVKPATRPPSGLGMAPAAPCHIKAASYGSGSKTVLVKSKTPAGEPLFVVLGVLEGFEQSMTASFLKTQPPGAEIAGEFPSKDVALAKAAEICQAG